jgi:DNA (cytosine-5)-methyltransferase 1
VLNAADFGVPQTRERAILIASRVRAVAPPEPTHAEHAQGEDLFGGTGRARWVSMAQALGWGLQAEPPPVVMTARGRQAGPEDVLRGSSWRAQWWQDVADDPSRFSPKPTGIVVNTRGDRKTPGGNEFSADRPSWALTEKTRSWIVSSPSGWAMGDVRSANGTVRPAGSPSATIPGAMDNGNWRWVYRGSNQANAARRPLNEPAPNVNFGARSNKVEWMPEPIAEDPKASGVRVTVQEAAVLQSFPWDYPWQGSKSRQFLQVGNAVCPLLAAHVVAAASGARFREEVAA